MNVPDELRRAYQQQYRQFSWLMPLKTQQTAYDFFRAGANFYQGTRFFWETPSRDFALVGLGQELTLTGKETTTANLNHFLQRQAVIRYQNMVVTGAGSLLFGGLPFDVVKPVTDEWGLLGQGLFYLPTIMLTFLEEQTYLTLNFSAASEAELTEKWHALTKNVAQLEEAATECLVTATVGAIQTEEVALTEWLTAVDRTVAKLKERDSLEKVVLARQLAVNSQHVIETDQVVKNLAQQQKNTYLFALEAGATAFIGATPERLLLGTKAEFATACIAGTIRTGSTPEETKALGAELLKDQKNTREHRIVVERLAKEIAAITTSENSIQAPIILENRDVQHLFVPIAGKRKKGVSFLESVMHLHPTPALGGEPKQLALEWIRNYEPGSRGLYGAPIGWISANEDGGEFAVGLRSGVFSEKKGTLYAGCGIVEASQAALEREETRMKFQPMLRGIGGRIK